MPEHRYGETHGNAIPSVEDAEHRHELRRRASINRIYKNKIIAWAKSAEIPVNPPIKSEPYLFFIAELFKIVDGKINRIEALVTPGSLLYVDRLARPRTGKKLI